MASMPQRATRKRLNYLQNLNISVEIPESNKRPGRRAKKVSPRRHGGHEGSPSPCSPCLGGALQSYIRLPHAERLEGSGGGTDACHSVLRLPLRGTQDEGRLEEIAKAITEDTK